MSNDNPGCVKYRHDPVRRELLLRKYFAEPFWQDANGEYKHLAIARHWHVYCHQRPAECTSKECIGYQ